MIIAQQRRLYWGRSERFPSTDHLFPICVWSLNGLFTSRFLPSYLRLCEDVCMSLQGPASGNCALWYSTFSLCFFLFPLHKCFPLWHVVFICWTQESLSLRVICLSRPARVMFFKPGSGNLFQCVIQGYDIYPFSICRYVYHTECPSACFTSVLHYGNHFSIPPLTGSLETETWDYPILVISSKMWNFLLGKWKNLRRTFSFSTCRFDNTFISRVTICFLNGGFLSFLVKSFSGVSPDSDA